MKSRMITLLTVLMVFSTGITANADTWRQDSHGYWYEREDGSYPQNETIEIGEELYGFNEHGYMYTNTWKEFGAGWYYFNADGSAARCRWIGSYFFGPSGLMMTNTWTPDGYYVGADGQVDTVRNFDMGAYLNKYDLWYLSSSERNEWDPNRNERIIHVVNEYDKPTYLNGMTSQAQPSILIFMRDGEWACYFAVNKQADNGRFIITEPLDYYKKNNDWKNVYQRRDTDRDGHQRLSQLSYSDTGEEVQLLVQTNKPNGLNLKTSISTYERY